jgi:hypothetical protein
MEKLHLRSPSLQEPFHHYPKLMCNVLEKKNNSNPKKPNNSNNKLGIAIFYSNIHESNIHKLYNRVLEP